MVAQCAYQLIFIPYLAVFFRLAAFGLMRCQLHFDEDCRTEKGTAFICIYKDDTQTVIWGKSMYHGRDKDANCEQPYCVIFVVIELILLAHSVEVIIPNETPTHYCSHS